MPSEDRPEKRAPGAADESTPGAHQEPGVGQEPSGAEERHVEKDVASRIDIEGIRPQIEQEQGQLEER